LHSGASSRARQNSTEDELCTTIQGGHPSAETFIVGLWIGDDPVAPLKVIIVDFGVKTQTAANKCRLTAHLQPTSGGSRQRQSDVCVQASKATQNFTFFVLPK
jgi:hypothetical protein